MATSVTMSDLVDLLSKPFDLGQEKVHMSEI